MSNMRPAGKTGVRFVLRPLAGSQGDKWRRISLQYHGKARRVHAVCWHAHREFFRELFSYTPEARVQTASTRKGIGGLDEKWYTAANFEHVFTETDINIGSMAQPILASEACMCPEGEFHHMSQYKG